MGRPMMPSPTKPMRSIARSLPSHARARLSSPARRSRMPVGPTMAARPRRGKRPARPMTSHDEERRPMPTLHANGIDLYYESQGAGPAVVLVHGFGDSAELWRAQVEAFRDRYQVVTLDMRGHARSAAPADLGLYTQDGVVEDVRAVMDAAGVG
ncbi:MAG: alpha/beta fold hydrolase, partial [Chloroflexi bacterium]|nr:alpha/beta fold hydrolase [Chloroflexota bacterium]